uniref:Uncharacterized protein n=2 Tax=Oryza nivara TaxID=4536 RepID=A0A0E0HHZ7_ORYNI
MLEFDGMMMIRSGEQSAAATKAEKQQQRPAAHRVAEAGGVVMALAKTDSKYQHHTGHGGHGQAADHHGPSSSSKAATAAAQKIELPRIYTTLSRKEKEEDFMAMKGTKLPQRPKKRPKLVEKQVNFVCPGMWLSDVTRSKYIVREKKSTKKVHILLYRFYPHPLSLICIKLVSI